MASHPRSRCESIVLSQGGRPAGGVQPVPLCATGDVACWLRKLVILPGASIMPGTSCPACHM